MRPLRVTNNRQGVSLLFLAALMAVFGAGLAVIMALLPNFADEGRLYETKQTIKATQDELLSFIVENSRLPVPDTNASGTENSGAAAGALPYQTMGLPAAVLDEAHIPLRYAVYRGASDADLASVLPNTTYSPDLPETSGLINYTCTTPVDYTNLLDFCKALGNARVDAASTSFVNIGPSSQNVAYALISGGLEDADGDLADRHFDGLNEMTSSTDYSFDNPATGRSGSYDDMLRGTRFVVLERQLSCEPIIGAMNALASVARSALTVAKDAEYRLSNAEVAMAIDATNIVLAAFSLALKAVDIPSCWVDVPLATTMCIATLGVTCCWNAVAIAVTCVIYTVGGAVTAIAAIVDASIKLEKSVTTFNAVKTQRDLTNTHLCNAITATVAADQRGGLL